MWISFKRDDLSKESEVIVDININKNEKTKIHRIYFKGNTALTTGVLKKAMKKTNEKFSLPNDWKKQHTGSLQHEKSLPPKNMRRINRTSSPNITNRVIVMPSYSQTVLLIIMRS